MIPIGRPFMDFLISALADAGFSDVCLVIGPEHRAVREYDDAGYLRRIVATPDSAPSGAAPVFASLNCWLFTREIFRACRAVTPSARGELELPQAVQLAIAEGWMQFEAVRVRAGVLDMSSRGDVASVAARLEATRVQL